MARAPPRAPRAVGAPERSHHAVRTRPRRWTAAGSTAHLEHGFDGAFGGALNPLKHLGALAFLLFWLLAATGIVLYAVLDTSAQGAYRSIDELSREPWSVGSALRGLHRYAADAFVVVTLAHLAREWLLGRFSGFRRFSWLTGVPLLPLAYRLRHRRLLAELGPARPVLRHRHRRMAGRAAVPGLAAGAQFPGRAPSSDRLFSLFVFVHLGVPLLLVFGAVVPHPAHQPRRGVPAARPGAGHRGEPAGAGAGAAGAQPGAGRPRAWCPEPLALDWFLLFIHPLDRRHLGRIRLGAVAGRARAAVRAALPARRAAPAPVAQVDPDQLQRLPPLRRRLPLRRHHDGAASERPARRRNWRR